MTHTTCLKCHVQNKLTGSRRLYVTFKTYPFGYERLTDQDIKIVNMLVDLWKQLEKEFGRVTSRVRTSPKCKIWCIWKIIPLLLLFFTYLFIYLFIYFTRRKNIISIMYDVFQARVDRPLSESWSVLGKVNKYRGMPVAYCGKIPLGFFFMPRTNCKARQ